MPPRKRGNVGVAAKVALGLEWIERPWVTESASWFFCVRYGWRETCSNVTWSRTDADDVLSLVA
jgi:hypothetical protein